MTARLVGLMSIVLFLSLLAFSLLLNHSRTAVLEEVEKTVCRVGSQTLHAVFGGEDEFEGADGATRGSWMGLPGDPLASSADPTGPIRVIREMRRDFVTTSEATGAASRAPTSPQAPQFPDMHPMQGYMLRGIVIAHDVPRARHRTDEELEVSITFLTASARVPAPGANDPSGMTGVPGVPAGPAELDSTAPLRTRMMQPVVDAGGASRRDEHAVGGVTGGAVVDLAEPATAQRGELVFTVPVDEYARVFDAIRERMIWLFIGVFVLGTALSAALARRFTRPIRDLDGALQRVSGGDLAVAVTPSGGAEVERLAIAFNTMTAQLRENRERERELIRREKLSSLGRLAAGVAHDVRNPLHSIGLTLQNLEDVCRPESEESRGVFGRAVELIRREIKRLDALVANFLSFARNEAGAKQVVRLPDLVRDTAQLVAKEAERRGITVVVDAEPTLEPIEVSPASLRSAILNLVLNSFEATPSGGTVTLRATSEDGAQVIEVADTGRGISEQDRERVFDFGFTSREGGNGLGLAMVHHTIVEEHGGRVSLDSAEGKGTRVRLELPAAGAEA